MITTKIIYDRKKKAKTEGTGTIEVRVTVARRAYYISTGVRVREREWKAGMIVNRPDAPVLNDRLAIIYEIVDREANRCIKAGEPVSTEILKAKVWPVKEAASVEPNFLEWVERQVEQLTVAYGTRKQYRTLAHRLHEFGEIQRWQDVTAENICAFDAWLHKRQKKDGTTLIDSAVFKYHRSLKALLNRAVTFSKIERNPYELLRGKFKRGDRENLDYLTEDEIDTLNRIVNLFLDFAELQAKNHTPMYMKDWIQKLDGFLQLSGKELLTHAGTISAEVAKLKANTEYDKFKARSLERLSPVEIHFIKNFENERKKLKR